MLEMNKNVLLSHLSHDDRHNIVYRSKGDNIYYDIQSYPYSTFLQTLRFGPHGHLWNVYFSYALFVDKSFHVYVHFQNKRSVFSCYLQSYVVLCYLLYFSLADKLKNNNKAVITHVEIRIYM
jgi:hypothetical protein